ncbi:hypothetical protein CR157_08815 [Halomonas sp. LBP4]|nr:hypothetical protein CR157_08815 [Halomonas sp. LBP4]
MRVFARLVLAPLLLLFMAVSPLPAQDLSIEVVSPAFHSAETDQGLAPIHPDALPSRPLMVASSRAHVGILWRSGGRVSTQFSFGTFDRHHRHGVVHRHSPGAVVIAPRHRAQQHDIHRGRHVPRHSGRGIRHRTRRHDGVRFGTHGRIHSPAFDIGPRRFERERFAPPHRGVAPHHFQRRKDIRRGLAPHHFQRREPIRRGIERQRFQRRKDIRRGLAPHHFQRRAPIRRGIDRHHFRGRGRQ